MKKSYNFKERDVFWQREWEKAGIFRAEKTSKKKKYYSLIEFPYPSGAGLHVGHPRPYIGMDIISRKRRKDGYNVLYPIGWDAFGLPTENFAIKTGQHPRQVTKQNTETFKKQIQRLGISFDWSREINTTDPQYYKWTQWIFLQLYKKGLAYKDTIAVNWCTSCKIGLANEEVVRGRCERCGGETEKRQKEQWLLKITEYAERLLKGLDTVDYSEPIKIQQRNWIGRSEGTILKFGIRKKNSDLEHVSVEVFTTRPDTLFGATYLVLAPEHPLVHEIQDSIENRDEVKSYVLTSIKKTDIERSAEEREKTGIEVKGISAINPANKKEVPVFIADYVLAHYGTGAIMAVPAHDERDFNFAKKYKQPILPVIQNNGTNTKGCYSGEGVLFNSETFDGLTSEIAKKKIAKAVKGKTMIIYKLRDWIFSRQRYWGEPIPILYCEKEGIVALPESELPLELPEVEKYAPTDTGESPLAAIDEWVNTTCPQCNSPAKRETDVMPNWAGSSWYFLRYTDHHNDTNLADSDVLNYWMPVDWYNGGMEHTTLHLLYSRFWNYFLYDIGVVPVEEPYKKRTSHGMILAEGGEKMSKSKNNVINPDDIVTALGADVFRLYEMFMGPFNQAIAWNSNDIVGIKRFLDKCYEFVDWLSKTNTTTETHTDVKYILHQTIRKVTDDIEAMNFNTAVSQLMICMNVLKKDVEVKGKTVTKKDVGVFVTLLSPFAPHIAEELWHMLGNKTLVENETWPVADTSLRKRTEALIVIQVNGKVRGQISLATGTHKKEVVTLAQDEENVKKWLEGKIITKTIYIQDTVLNFVVQ